MKIDKNYQGLVNEGWRYRFDGDIATQEGLIIAGVTDKKEADAMVRDWFISKGFLSDGMFFSPMPIEYFSEIIRDTRKDYYWWGTSVMCDHCGQKRKYDWKTFGFVCMFIPFTLPENQTNISRITK